MEVSFKAQLINKCNILKYNNISKDFSPYEVSFVELNCNKWRDKLTLRKTAKLWAPSYAKEMLKNQRSSKGLRIFALTEQNSDFERLDANKILGLGQIRKEDLGVYNIDYLQTHPEHKKFAINQKYKNIGTAMLDNFKKAFWNNKITLVSLYEVIDFYLNNNFKYGDLFSGLLVWRKEFEKD